MKKIDWNSVEVVETWKETTESNPTPAEFDVLAEIVFNAFHRHQAKKQKVNLVKEKDAA